MMARVTTSRTPRWAIGVSVGVVTALWVAASTVQVPAATATEDGSSSGSTVAGVSSPSTPPDGVPIPLPAPGAAQSMIVAPSAGGPIRVTGVELTDVGPKAATVVIKTDRAVESYESFALSHPPRLVIDIPNAVHAVPKAGSASGPVTEIRSSQYKAQPVKVVRIVLDLATALPYQVLTAPGPFHVVIGEGASEGVMAPVAQTTGGPTETLAQAAPPPETPAPQPPEAPQGRVESVDYRPQDGLAEIVVRTSGPVTYNVSEIATPPTFILDVTGAVIDPQATRVLDVRQVPGPVQRVRAAQYRLEPEKTVRIVADLKGQVRHELVQTPDAIRVTLEGTAPAPAVAAAPQPEPKPEPRPTATPAAAPQAPPAPAPAAPPAEAMARLSMDFKDVDMNNLLRIIAEVSGQNIVAGEDVKGKVTVRLVDVPWDVALDNILRINGFGFVREDNIIRVAKMDTIRREQEQRRKDQLEMIRLQEEAAAEPLQHEILRVSYADPKKVVESLTKVKSKRGTISVDERTASLLIEDTAANIAKMRAILKELDQATPQVMIEGRIVTVVARHTRALGIQWGFQRGNPTSSRQFVVSDIFGAAGPSLPNPPGPGVSTGPIPTAFATSIPAAVNLPISGPAGAIGLILGSVADQIRLNVQLSALEQQSLARTLSTPRIVALDNQEAEIKQGEEVPFTTVDSSGRTTVTFKEAVLSLKVTPHITADRRVSLKVKATDDTRGERIDFAGGFAFPFNRNEATSSLLIDNGTTVVIGGVRKRTESVAEDRVPFLGDIPVLGWLFKRRVENIQPESLELLIFITPTILEESRQARR